MSCHEVMLSKQELGPYIMTLCLTIPLSSLELWSHLEELLNGLITPKLLNIKTSGSKR